MVRISLIVSGACENKIKTGMSDEYYQKRQTILFGCKKSYVTRHNVFLWLRLQLAMLTASQSSSSKVILRHLTWLPVHQLIESVPCRVPLTCRLVVVSPDMDRIDSWMRGGGEKYWLISREFVRQIAGAYILSFL